MKKYVYTSIVLLFFCCVAYGQISTREEPVSLKSDVPAFRASEKTQKTLPSLDMRKIEREDEEADARGMPPRFGYRHRVDYDLENSGEWTELSNGDKLWRLSVSCPGALSINLLYDKFWIPDGAKIWVYNADCRHHIGAFTSANNI